MAQLPTATTSAYHASEAPIQIAPAAPHCDHFTPINPQRLMSACPSWFSALRASFWPARHKTPARIFPAY